MARLLRIGDGDPPFLRAFVVRAQKRNGSRPSSPVAKSMSLAKLLFPKPHQGRQRRQFRALRTGVILGLIVSVLIAVGLYLMNLKQKP